MKKITIIVQQKDAKDALNSLRKLGLVHVEHQLPPKGKDITQLNDDLSLVNQALEIISKEELVKKFKIKEEKAAVDWRQTAHHIIDLWKRLDRLQEYSKTLKAQISEWKVWGDFDPKDIEKLSEQNIHIGLYRLPQKELSKIPQGAVVKTISIQGATIYCAVITKEKIDFGFKQIELPHLGLEKMQQRLLEDEQAINEINLKLTKHIVYRNSLIKIRQSLEKELEFQQALKGMAEAGSLSYLVGFTPRESEKDLLSLAKQEKWGIVITDPAEEDNVPVLLRNPKWVSLINPVFKLMEVVPGYRELDVSPIFLLFLSLFFGMIIGDAGYGAIYLLLTFLAQRKLSMRIRDKAVFFLFYLFSSCAILWGLLTGTFFGQEWYAASGFKALIPVLNEAKFLMSFCFLIGAIQLSLAHAWQAIVKLPSLKCLADVGFICLLWVGFFLAKMFIVGETFPNYGKWLIWIGILCIIFFSNPQRNVLKAALKGLGVLALGAMGNFGDVVSYIRLFAMGLASVAVADSVNNLAAGVSNIVAQIIILFIGHTINIILGPISVLVHGIRLNILEFSVLHGNVTWSGLAYKPLKS